MSAPLEVSFTWSPPQLPGGGTVVVLDSRSAAGRPELTLVRGAFLVLAAVGVAFVTQRAGQGLWASVGVFVFMLPCLWVVGALLGLLALVPRARAEAVARAERGGTEQVRLRLLDEGLQVTREGRERQVPYALVRVERLPTQVQLTLGPEGFVIPAPAFASADACDAFCLELQRRRAAQRA